jgi:hypothetical protein
MANVSSSIAAIDTVAKCLSAAAEAARGLDHAKSRDLCSLLTVTASEAERVRKATRKTSAPRKMAVKAPKAAKPEKKIVKQASMANMAVKPRGRKKAAAPANGIAH